MVDLAQLAEDLETAEAGTEVLTFMLDKCTHQLDRLCRLWDKTHWWNRRARKRLAAHMLRVQDKAHIILAYLIPSMLLIQDLHTQMRNFDYDS